MLDKMKYDSLIDIVTKLESKLIPLNSHIRGIAEYFIALSYPDEVSNWFWISSSITSVNYDGLRRDCAFQMCRPAYEYEIEKQKLHSQLINDLTIFLYVYNGFESLLNELGLPDHPMFNGKINAAKNYIKKEYSENFPTIQKYQEAVNILQVLISNSSLIDNKEFFVADDCTDYNSIGLKVVYKLRNKLAHGDFIFPEPLEWSFHSPLEPAIIKLSTRILLFSIQMLMLAKNHDSFGDIELHESEVFFNENFDDFLVINEATLLRTLHIPMVLKDKSQLELEFE